jgi:hypothetical protein
MLLFSQLASEQEATSSTPKPKMSERPVQPTAIGRATATSAPTPPKPKFVRTLRRIRNYLAEQLGEPELSIKSVEWWVESKRIRTYKFGNQLTAKTDELDEDVTRPRERDAA